MMRPTLLSICQGMIDKYSKLKKGFLHVEKVVITGLVTVEDLSKVDVGVS